MCLLPLSLYLQVWLLFPPITPFLLSKWALFKLPGGIRNNRGQTTFGVANQTLHPTPDTWAVPAGAEGGAGELVVRVAK